MKVNKKVIVGLVVGLGTLLAVAGITLGLSYDARLMAKDAWQYISGGPQALAPSEARYIRQMVGKEAEVDRTIVWQSDMAQEDAFVEYRLVSDDSEGHPVSSGNQESAKQETLSDKQESSNEQAPSLNEVVKVSASNQEFTDDGKTTYIHEALLEQLLPDSSYQYRVGYGDKVSDWHDLKTGDGHSSYTALIFPDSQSVDYSTWGNVVRDAYARNPNAAFFTVMGDLVDNGEDSSQWRAWMNETSPVMDKIPAGTVIGNHETYTINWTMRDPVAYTSYFEYPQNGTDRFKDRYYSFDYGDVHYVSLDTTFPEMEGIHDDLNQVVADWLEKDLAQNTKKWTVVMMHRDILRYPIDARGRTAGVEDFAYTFVPIFEKYKVDIVFTGHLHTYRNRGHLLDYQPNPAGPLYILSGIAGDTTVKNFWNDHPLDRVKAPNGQDTENYITLDVSEGELVMKAFLPDGTQFDEEHVVK